MKLVLEGDLPTNGTASTFDFGLPIPVGTDSSLSSSGVSIESAAICSWRGPPR